MNQYVVLFVLCIFMQKLALADDQLFTYELTSSNEATITGCYKKCPTSIKIPNKIDWYTITGVGVKAFSEAGLTSVTLNESVLRIEREAFHFNYLTNVTLPSNLEVIGEAAFSQNQWQIITIPASVLVGDPWLALVLLSLLILCFSGPIALGISALLQVTPNEMRGQLSAVYLLIVNFLGIGFGPTLVALVTDFGFGDDSALGYSLAIVGGGASIAAALLLLGGRGAFLQSLERAKVWSQSDSSAADRQSQTNSYNEGG